MVARARQHSVRERRGHHERQHLAHDDLVGRRGFVGRAAQLGKLRSPVRGAMFPQDFLGRAGTAPARGQGPQGHQAHVPADQGRRVEQCPQVSPGGVLEQLAVLAHVDCVSETVRAADGDRPVSAAVDGRPPERAGYAADAGGVEHLHRAAIAGPDTRGEPVHVGLGRSRQHRARVVHDDPRQPAGFAGPRRRHHEHVLLKRHPQPVPVMRPAQHDRVSGRTDHDPRPERQRGTDFAAAAERREAPPAQPQLNDGGVPAPRVQPQPDTDPVVAHPVAGQLPVRDERPHQEPGGQDHDEQDDEDGEPVVGDQGHRAPPWASRCRYRTLLAEPHCIPTSAARSLATCDAFVRSP